MYVIAVAVDPLNPNIVYAGTGDNEGLFKSTDYGDTWASVGTGLSGAITFLTIDPTKIGRLFASTGMAFFLSEDGGHLDECSKYARVDRHDRSRLAFENLRHNSDPGSTPKFRWRTHVAEH